MNLVKFPEVSKPNNRTSSIPSHWRLGLQHTNWQKSGRNSVHSKLLPRTFASVMFLKPKSECATLLIKTLYWALTMLRKELGSQSMNLLQELALAYLSNLITHCFPMIYHDLATLPFLRSPAHTNSIPASGTLHMPFPLSGTLFPHPFERRPPSLHWDLSSPVNYSLGHPKLALLTVPVCILSTLFSSKHISVGRLADRAG